MSSYVRAIQTQLKDAGFYDGDVDGIAGPKTVSAVQKALTANKLSVSDARIVTEQSTSDPEYVAPPKTPAPNTRTKGYVFSQGSLNNLEGVDPKLVRVVHEALRVSEQDFAVLEGLRTITRQRELLKKGATQTLESKHLKGLAVDLVPVVNGQISWDWKYYYNIARAMKQAAESLNVRIRWGGAWAVLNGAKETPEQLVAEYVALKRKQGKKAFTDGPHFELF